MLKPAFFMPKHNLLWYHSELILIEENNENQLQI
jgi:hypothetical protein